VVRHFPLPAARRAAGTLKQKKTEKGYFVQNVIEVINAVGFPAAVVLILLLFLWRACRYFAPLGHKVVNEHLEFVRHTMEHQEHQTESLSKQTHLIESLGQTVEKAISNRATDPVE